MVFSVEELNLRLQHYNQALMDWEDVIPPIDQPGESWNYTTNEVCGSVTSLSPFALLVPEVVGGLVVDLDGGPELAAQPSGDSAGRLAGTIAGVAALAVLLTGAAWYARRRRRNQAEG